MSTEQDSVSNKERNDQFDEQKENHQYSALPGIANEDGYRKLRVWNGGMEMVMQIYDLCEDMPPCEKYGLSAQMKDAAVSMPSNIAEGCAGGTIGLFLRHVRVACASAAELETQLLIVRHRQFVAPDVVNNLLKSLINLRKGLFALRNYLRDHPDR